MDYLRGEDSHVGQEKELQFDVQLIGSTVSYFKNVWREGGFPTYTQEATLENRNVNFIPSNLLEEKEWHTVWENTRLNCVVTIYKMRKNWWMNALYSVSPTTGDINIELEI